MTSTIKLNTVDVTEQINGLKSVIQTYSNRPAS